MKKNNTKKLGVFGGSLSSAVGYTHYCASRIDGKWSFSSGIFSRNKKENQKSKAYYCPDFDHEFKNHEEYIQAAKDEVDAFLVLTPPGDHFKIISSCLKQNKNVISEKPLVMNVEECLKLEKLLNKTNAKLLITYNYTGYPMVVAMKEIIAQGKIGKINSVRIEMPQEGFSRLTESNKKPKPQKWRKIDANVPTIYLDLLTHMNHLNFFLTNEFSDEVVAIENQFGKVKTVVDDVCILAKSKNSYCSYWLSKSYLGQRNGLSIRISGEKGTLEWIQNYPEDLIYVDEYGRRSKLDRSSLDFLTQKKFNRFKAGHPSGFIEAFGNIYSTFYDCLDDNEDDAEIDAEYYYGIENTVKIYKFLDAVNKAANESSWVKVK